MKKTICVVIAGALLLPVSGFAQNKPRKGKGAAKKETGTTPNDHKPSGKRNIVLEKEYTTPSGLKYKMQQLGTGPQATAGSTVSVHYVGKLTDGKIFDSSRERGEPISFNLGTGRVIRGWDEGIALMRVGDRATLTIPPELGYGPQAMGSIPANSTLVFDVELMGVKERVIPKPWIMPSKDTVTTASGLKYIVVSRTTNAAAPKAEKGKTVSVHYTGFLRDSEKIFDSSVERGEPFSFPLGMGQVIKGWDEGISLMQVGDRLRLIIPPDLGYGDNGAGGVIPPKATLCFDVELMDVK